MTIIIAKEDILIARQTQSTISEVTGSSYTVIQIMKAMDCAVTDKGVAERILIELGKDIKFDRASNSFLIKSEGEYKKVGAQLVRDIVDETIDNLPKEIRIINDAVKAGILSDAESHKKAIIRYVDRSCPNNVYSVISIMKKFLNG